MRRYIINLNTIFTFIFLASAPHVYSSEPAQTLASTPAQPLPLQEFCENELSKLPGPFTNENLKNLCAEMRQLENCQSQNGLPIMHYEKSGTDKTVANAQVKKILAISLIHGDETPSGSVTRAWIHRLQEIDARNTWRVIPLANPDGFRTKTRYNASGVDLNRNFPSKDWEQKAITYWEKTTKKDRRRYPGPSSSSEPETKCLVQHINEFKPDFIISVHTPLGVLDFDGPRLANPGFKPLPWVGLGNFSGSLGRYMWIDNKVPVLTIELKGNSGLKRLEDFDHLQDISGTVAIQAGKLLNRQSMSQKDQHQHKRNVR